MTNKLKWLLLGPCLAALLVFGPSLAGAETPGKKAALTPDESSVPSTRVLVSLCGVLALAAATLLLWRRLGGSLPARGRASERQLRVHETLRLSPRNRVHLVSVSGQMLLLGEGEKGVDILHQVASAAQPALAAAAPRAIGTSALAAFAAEADEGDDDGEDGVEPRDMILQPAPRRPRPPARTAASTAASAAPSTVADFRQLLEKVRAEVAS